MKPLIAILLVVTLPLCALDLQDAVETALASRGDVESARLTAESASWQSTGANLWFLPSISGQLVFQRSHDVQSMEIPGMGSIPVGSEYSSIAGITASLPLFIPQGPSGARMASRAEDMALDQVDAAEFDAVVQVVQAFYGVLLAQEMNAVSGEALDIARQGYEIASIKYEAGTISRFEHLQSRVAWENRIPDAIDAEIALENAITGLAVSMGIERGTPFTLEGSLEEGPDVPLPTTIEDARTIMESHSPDLRIAEGMRLLGDAGVDMARSEFLPMLVFQTDYNFQASRDDWHFETGDYDRSWSSSIALQIPIFTGFSDIAGYNSARADRLASHAGARSMEQAAEFSLTQAWNGYHSSREREEATSATVEQAGEAAAIAGVSYEAGAITRLDMDQAFLALTTARTNHASALYGLRIAEVQLMRAIGLLEGYTR